MDLVSVLSDVLDYVKSKNLPENIYLNTSNALKKVFEKQDNENNMTVENINLILTFNLDDIRYKVVIHSRLVNNNNIAKQVHYTITSDEVNEVIDDILEQSEFISNMLYILKNATNIKTTTRFIKLKKIVVYNDFVELKNRIREQNINCCEACMDHKLSVDTPYDEDHDHDYAETFYIYELLKLNSYY